MPDLLQMFVIGVVSSYGACMISCWPIALPFVTVASDTWQRRLQYALVFLLAKLVVYGVLGFAAAALGRVLTVWLRFHGETLLAISGGAILLLGVRAMLTDAHPCNAALRRFKLSHGLTSSALLGLIVGILPCATSTAVLAYIAFTAESPLFGAALGLAFGVGKFFSPLLLATVFVSYFAAHFKPNRVWMRWMCGILIATMGLRLLFSLLPGVLGR